MSKKMVVCAVLLAMILNLASTDTADARNTLVMILGGAAVGVGALLAGTSSESVETRDPFTGTTFKVSARSNTQLATGLIMAGGGVALMIAGARMEEDFIGKGRTANAPRFTFLAAPTKKGFWSGVRVTW